MNATRVKASQFLVLPRFLLRQNWEPGRLSIRKTNSRQETSRILHLSLNQFRNCYPSLHAQDKGGTTATPRRTTPRAYSTTRLTHVTWLMSQPLFSENLTATQSPLISPQPQTQPQLSPLQYYPPLSFQTIFSSPTFASHRSHNVGVTTVVQN